MGTGAAQRWLRTSCWTSPRSLPEAFAGLLGWSDLSGYLLGTGARPWDSRGCLGEQGSEERRALRAVCRREAGVWVGVASTGGTGGTAASGASQAHADNKDSERQ